MRFFLIYILKRLTVKTEQFGDVLRFWFPSQLSGDAAAMVRQWEWWFRGGADTDITQYFPPLLNRATLGELDAWSHEPQSRLALRNFTPIHDEAIF